jgi:hypothetical protein
MFATVLLTGFPENPDLIDCRMNLGRRPTEFSYLIQFGTRSLYPETIPMFPWFPGLP